jgi:hypothetical protein
MEEPTKDLHGFMRAWYGEAKQRKCFWRRKWSKVTNVAGFPSKIRIDNCWI